MSEESFASSQDVVTLSNERSQRIARWLLWPLMLALFVATILFYVLYSPFQVDGDSMEPSLADGDSALRTKGYETPRHGDVIVVDVRSPSESDDIVKRVVAVSGDSVEVRDDIALVNGVVEETPSVLRVEGAGEYRSEVTVPEGSVYVLGDNRPVSLDSRYVGVLPVSKIRGKVVFVFLPLSRFGPVH